MPQDDVFPNPKNNKSQKGFPLELRHSGKESKRAYELAPKPPSGQPTKNIHKEK